MTGVGGGVSGGVTGWGWGFENVSSFTEFVKAFSQFGNEMVELAHLSGDRQNVSVGGEEGGGG